MNALEEQVDETINSFDRWFQTKKMEPLHPLEKAILKTFCWYLTQERAEKSSLENILATAVSPPLERNDHGSTTGH